MEVVKKTNRYTIFKKRSGRYGVRSAGGAWINGEDKAKILSDEGLINLPKNNADESSDNSLKDDGENQEESSQKDSSEEATT